MKLPGMDRRSLSERGVVGRVGHGRFSNSPRKLPGTTTLESLILTEVNHDVLVASLSVVRAAPG